MNGEQPGRATDPRVDAYIAALPAWQQDICRQVRAAIHAADPDIEETIKRRTQPYFVLQGNVCALLAAKDHVNVFVYDGGIVPDPDHIITGGHDNTTARTVAIGRDQPIPTEALTALLRQIVADNRAGARTPPPQHPVGRLPCRPQPCRSPVSLLRTPSQRSATPDRHPSRRRGPARGEFVAPVSPSDAARTPSTDEYRRGGRVLTGLVTSEPFPTWLA